MFRQGTGTVDSRHRGFFAEAGDARQVWARWTDVDRVFFLEDGAVTEEVRRDCSEGRLVCPMADCSDPRFVARGGAVRRHHFAHRVAHVKHATAAIWRHEAMAMLADWASRYRGAEVQVRDGQRAASVRICSERSGRAVELVVTYDRRFEVSRDELSRPGYQLLVGHTRGLLLPRKPCAAIPDTWWCGSSRLVSDILLWHDSVIAVNPEQRLVATLVDVYAALRAGLLARRALTQHPLLCVVCELESCRLTEHGLVTPTSEQLIALRPPPAPQRPEAPRPQTPAPVPAFTVGTRGDPRQAEYLRRAEGLDTEQRLALLKEMFLPTDRATSPAGRTIVVSPADTSRESCCRSPSGLGAA